MAINMYNLVSAFISRKYRLLFLTMATFAAMC